MYEVSLSHFFLRHVFLSFFPLSDDVSYIFPCLFILSRNVFLSPFIGLESHHVYHVLLSSMFLTLHNYHAPSPLSLSHLVFLTHYSLIIHALCHPYPSSSSISNPCLVLFYFVFHFSFFFHCHDSHVPSSSLHPERV